MIFIILLHALTAQRKELKIEKIYCTMLRLNGDRNKLKSLWEIRTRKYARMEMVK